MKIRMLVILIPMMVWGCAFDISHMKQLPVSFATVTGAPESFVLNQEVTVALGTGFPTRLKAGTRWHQVGRTEYGKVFATSDQIVTVEASNICEAQLVVSDQHLVTGFYLPVEKSFSPASHPFPLATSSDLDAKIQKLK